MLQCDLMILAPEHVFEAEQFVPRPKAEVFAFFCSETNLESLTPPFLNFKVLGKSTPEIQEGTLIDYVLKIYGIPVKWRTRIELWRPGESFVDTQLRGPYKKWHHTHTFKDVPGGTLMSDRVVYQVPLGGLGEMVAGWKVRRDVQNIFSFRRQKIAELFPAAQPPGSNPPLAGR